MGILIDGVWHEPEPERKNNDGRFDRVESIFRSWVTPDGEPGPTGNGGFAAASGRYHLYISLSCPWAHRTLLIRNLKGLQDVVGVSISHEKTLENSWTFRTDGGIHSDPVNGAEYMHQVYTSAEANYSGRVTVPVLWDRQESTIVNNESSEIIRMFNSAFDRLDNPDIRRDLDLYPEDLRAEIDAVNDDIYENVNNGVYRTGFSRSQEAYDDAVVRVFATLDRMEERLAGQRYLVGDRVTEADWRFFTTLVRFDLVYYAHFKCNLRRLAEYPNLQNYVTELYQMPGVAETVSFEQIKENYYGSQRRVNPTGIVPLGPHVDFTVPHDRDRFAIAAE